MALRPPVAALERVGLVTSIQDETDGRRRSLAASFVLTEARRAEARTRVDARRILEYVVSSERRAKGR